MEFQELLLRFFHGHGDGDGCTDHGVVAHSDQTHHFYVGGNGGRACELSVAVHTTNSVVHAAV